MKKVGIALSGGGARAYAHIGVLKVMLENNIPIDYIAGTSMGSLIAAYYALYNNIYDLEKLVKNFRKREMLSLLDFNDPRVSLIKGEKIKKFLIKHFGNKKFQDTKIPLKITASSLEDGSLIVFEKGSIIDACIASSTVPGILPVVKSNNRNLVDGGLADAVPVDQVQEMGADIIIAVDLYCITKNKPRTYGSLQALHRTFDIFFSKLVNYNEKEYGNHIIVLKPKVLDHLETLAFYKTRENIKAGEEEALKQLSKIKKLVK